MFGKPKLKTKINILTPCYLEKGKDRLKTTVITQQNHATNGKRTIHQHTKPCMFKPTRKSHMQKVTCKYSYWSFLILLSFLSLCLLFLSCSKARVLHENSKWPGVIKRENNEIDTNLNWQKVSKILPTDPQKLFYEWGL